MKAENIERPTSNVQPRTGGRPFVLLSPGMDTITAGDEFWDGRQWRPEVHLYYGMAVDEDMSPIRRAGSDAKQ